MIILKEKDTERFVIRAVMRLQRHGMGVNATTLLFVYNKSMRKEIFKIEEEKFFPNAFRALEFAYNFFAEIEVPVTFNEINVSWETDESLAGKLFSVLFSAYSAVGEFMDFYESFCR